MAFTYRKPQLPVDTSPRISTLSYATYPSIRSARQSARRSAPLIQPPSPAAPLPARRHPFSASALSDPTLQTEEWNAPISARSTRTIDTVAAHSIHNAVVQVGQRARAASRNENGPFEGVMRQEDAPGSGTMLQSPWNRQLAGMIVPSQVAYAEHLDLDYAQANSLSARPRPTVETPSNNFHDDDVSDLISPASRHLQDSNFRLSRFGEGPSRPQESAAASRRTSYRTSFIPESPSSPESMPFPLHDSRSISSSERTRSVSVSFTQESSVDHRRSVSIPTPNRWPTFNAGQFRAAGYGRSTSSGRSRASSTSSPSSVHRPPPLPLPTLPSAGIRQAQIPRGPRPPPLSASAQSPRFHLS